MEKTNVEPATNSHTMLTIRAIVRVALLVALCTAGGLHGYWYAWVLLGVCLTMFTTNVVVMRLRNPDLFWERLKPDKPTHGWDLVFFILSGIFSLGLFVVAPLDVLYLHGPKVPIAMVVVGVVVSLAGNAIVSWCMGTNPFLERTVRIQEERDHRVITTGPYRFVRHPMYTGFIVLSMGLPLIMGSFWAFIPVVLLDITVIVRTFFEDRTLQDELPGYPEYAEKTRYRLVPGVW